MVYGQTAWSLKEKAERHRLVLVSRLPRSTVGAAGLLPAADLPVAPFEQDLTCARLAAWVAPTGHREVNVYLPSFELNTQVQLAGARSPSIPAR